MAIKKKQAKRVNRTNPTDEIVTMLDDIADRMKDTALLISEYATNFNGQTKAEMDAAACGLRAMRHKVVSAKMTVEDAEDARI